MIAIDTVAERLAMARTFGAHAVHLTEEDPRAAAKQFTGGRGVDVAIEAVGDPRALDLAIRMARKAGTVSVVGVYAERAEVHMGLAWIKSLTIRRRAGERHRARGPRARAAGRRAAGSRPARHPPHAARRRPPRPTTSTTAREALKIVLTP